MKKVEGTAYVRLDIEVQVILPEGIEFAEDEGSDQLSDACKERAIEAAVSAFPDDISIYIDGDKKPPVQVTFDVGDSDVQEVRGEED